MKTKASSILRLLAAGLAASIGTLVIHPLDAAAHPVAQGPRGVTVEEVGPGSAGEKVGIKPDDVLLSWVRAANPPANPKEARGEIGSPFDLMDLITEQTPRGQVTISGKRDGSPFSVPIPPGKWGIAARPQMADPVLVPYRNGKAGVQAKDSGRGIALWREAVAHVGKTNGALTSWLPEAWRRAR